MLALNPTRTRVAGATQLRLIVALVATVALIKQASCNDNNNNFAEQAQAAAQAAQAQAQSAASSVWDNMNSAAAGSGLGGAANGFAGFKTGGGGSFGTGSGFGGSFGLGGGSSGAGNGGFDLNSMLGFATQAAMNPVGTSLKYMMPQTYHGFGSDLNRNMMYMANGAQNGMSQLANGYQSMLGASHDMVGKLLMANPIVQALASNRMLSMNADEARRVIDMIQNPDEMCKAMSQQTQQGVSTAMNMQGQVQDQANKVMQSASNTAQSALSSLSPVSMLNRFGLSLGR